MINEKYRESIPFFSDLPAKAEKAASSLWDSCRSPDYNGALAYNVFVQDLSFQGVAAPPRAIVKRWIAGVQANFVPRPGGEAVTPRIIECDDADVMGAEAVSSDFQPLTPSDFLPAAQVMLDPAEALGAAFEHLVDAAVEELQRDVRKQARMIAASRMRQMLDAMEASDA